MARIRNTKKYVSRAFLQGLRKSLANRLMRINIKSGNYIEKAKKTGMNLTQKFPDGKKLRTFIFLKGKGPKTTDPYFVSNYGSNKTDQEMRQAKNYKNYKKKAIQQ